MKKNYLELVESWTKNQSFEEKINSIFTKVRDIPYGDIGSRDPLDILKQNKGTCSGKHFLLKELYSVLNIPIKEFIVMHKFNNLQVNFPLEIKELLEKNEIIDPHNYIQIKPFDKWITVDVTWNKELEKLGFPVNKHWNGKESMPVSVVTTNDVYETTEPEKLKKELIKKLTYKQQENRRLFLKMITKWIENSNFTLL